jgi:hypothetical protein
MEKEELRNLILSTRSKFAIWSRCIKWPAQLRELCAEVGDGMKG